MADQVRACYDELATNYHLLFADWNTAIARQAAIIGRLLEQEISRSSNLKILDCACGIGTQTLGLAQRGHQLTGCDLSRAAVERARREASARGLNIQFTVVDMLDLRPIPENGFDAIVCLDNALPHLESFEQLCQATTGMRRKLHGGGILIASIRDYDRLVQERPAVHEPAFYLDEGQRRIVHQVWDWTDHLRYTFHLYITREVATGWESYHYASTYRALLRNELTTAIEAAGFTAPRWIFPAESGFYQPILIAKAGN